MTTKAVNFRFTEADLYTLQWLSALEGASRTEVLRKAVAVFRDLILMANRDSTAVLETLRERYGPEAEVWLWVSEGADGEPEADIRIGGSEPTDVGARAMKSGDQAIAFLELHDADGELVVRVGDDYLRIRPRLHAGVLPWPPGPFRIVIPLKELTPSTIPADVLATLEAIEA